MEENQHAQTEPDLLPSKVIDGKDELNLAEFPLSAIADRLNPDQKTLSFEDRIFDASRGEMVTRQLIITGSDQYGLPTALDDEVILGLVQLSKIANFSDRHVSFTRYQLIQLLGWGDEGKNYERLEKSLNRWVGVTLYYKNAWWSKEEQRWKNESFHILDNVTLYDREQARHRADAKRQSQLPLSTFTWNDVIFRSFQAGNIKSVDFDFLKGLNSAIAKRLYRFLDKRFFHRDRWEFDLKEVSWEHIGLSRNYDAAGLKRKLLPAIQELEQRGFIKVMPVESRFSKLCSGQWRVFFEQSQSGKTTRPKVEGGEGHLLVQALLERGVTPTTAQQTVKEFSVERIRSQLEVFDWLVTQNDSKVSRNPAGFLISSIKGEYAPPRGFVSREEMARREAQTAKRKEREQRQAQLKAEREKSQQAAREDALKQFWQSYSAEERERMEKEALDQATTMQRDLLQRGGAFAATTRKLLLDGYALKILQAGT